MRPALALLLTLTACVAAPPLPIAPTSELSRAIATPARPPEHDAVLMHLSAKDAAMRRGDSGKLEELLDPAAPLAFRSAQAALLVVAAQRPAAFIEWAVIATRTRLDLLEAEIIERDDQGRARQRRLWFAGPLDALRQTEPRLADLGPERVDEQSHFRFVYRELDAPQVEVTRALGEEWLRAYAARLGDGHAPQRTIEVRFAPTQEAWPEGLPAIASAAVSRGVFFVLSSTAMLASAGDAAAFSRTLVGHELAHVLLNARGRRFGGFLLNEGLPLWLTDDTRALELARLVRHDELWPLERLLRGPQGDAEFFAAYAQASSLVRFVAQRYGEAAPLRLWEAAASAPSFDTATRLALGASAAELHRSWNETVRAEPTGPQPVPAFFDVPLAR